MPAHWQETRGGKKKESIYGFMIIQKTEYSLNMQASIWTLGF